LFANLAYVFLFATILLILVLAAVLLADAETEVQLFWELILFFWPAA